MTNFDANFRILKPSRLEHYFSQSGVAVSRNIEQIENSRLFKTMIAEYHPEKTWVVKIASEARIIGKIFWQTGRYNSKVQNNEFGLGDNVRIQEPYFQD